MNNTEVQTILLIEDNPGDIRLVKEMLNEITSFNYKLISAETLKEGSEQIRRNHFVLILLDLNLPDSTGKATFDKVENCAGDIPVVLVSGLQDEQLSLSLIKEGAQDYILKQELNSIILRKTIQYAVLRKEAEISLLSSESKYHAIFDNVQDVFYQTDLAGTVLEVSPSIKHFTEFNRAEIIGNSVSDLYNYPADREMLISKLKADGELRDYELILKTKTGKLKYTSINARLIFDADGTPNHIDGSIRDLTERKLAEEKVLRSEQLYRNLFEKANEGLILLTMDGKIAEVNQSFAKMHGYTVEEMKSIDIRDLDVFSKDTFNVRAQEMERIFAGEVVRFEVEHYHKDGHKFFMNNTASLITIENQQYFLAFHQDITERKQAEDELKESKEQLSNFAANLQLVREEERVNLAREIHDGLAQLSVALKMDMGLFKKRISKTTEAINQEEVIAEMEQLMCQVDNANKSARGIINGLRPEQLELLGFVEAAEVHLISFEKTHQIKCSFKNKVLNLNIQPDQAIALFRILQESLNNILKHAMANTITVQLSIIACKLVMEISDNGIGFDVNIKCRPDSYGLIGMKERIKLLGGNLDISSKMGEGTSVRVEIPYGV